MEISVGAVLEGRITGITSFGAFVALEGGKSGLVHISEVANAFVSDINEFLKLGQTVKVRVMGINEQGKINLSIKRAELQQPQRSEAVRHVDSRKIPTRPPVREAPPVENKNSGNMDFEDRLKKFMQESDSRIADNRMYSERRPRSKRR